MEWNRASLSLVITGFLTIVEWAKARAHWHYPHGHNRARAVPTRSVSQQTILPTLLGIM